MKSYKDTINEAYRKVLSEDKVPDGKADNISVQDIAAKHNVEVTVIEDQIVSGIKIEMEHTKDRDIAKEIAMDHLVEFPDYYTRLDKMEKEGEKAKEE